MDPVGSEELLRKVGYHPPIGTVLQRFFRRNPDEIYIIGIEAVTLITVVALIMSVVKTQGGWGLIFGALLLVLFIGHHILSAARPASHRLSTTSSDEWHWQNPLPQGNPLFGVSCPSATTCFAVGE